jgi:hypothetical protein
MLIFTCLAPPLIPPRKRGERNEKHLKSISNETGIKNDKISVNRNEVKLDEVKSVVNPRHEINKQNHYNPLDSGSSPE